MKIKSVNELARDFEEVFNTEPNIYKLETLVDAFGIEKVQSVLMFFMINGVKPPAPGKRNNPYGLILKVCQNWEV